MNINRKKSQGIALYPEDWERINNLREHRETKIEFIETALIHEFERREMEASRPKRVTHSLTDLP